MSIFQQTFRSKSFIFSLFFIFFLGMLPLVFSEEEKSPPRAPDAKEIQQKWKTTNPKYSREFSTLLVNGTVESRQAVSVSSRRDGIVQDIFVSINDRVEKGDVLAVLLPKGVEGESAASIAKKKSEVEKARDAYQNALRVREEQMELKKQKVEESDSSLKAAIAEKDTLGKKWEAQVTNTSGISDATLESAQKALELAEENFSIAKKNLASAQNNSNSQRETSSTKVEEAEKQLLLSADHALQTVQEILFEQTGREDIRDLSLSFGFRDPQSRVDLGNEYRKFSSQYDTFSLLEKSENAQQMLNITEKALNNSLNTENYSQEKIDSNIEKIHAAETRILAAEEKYALAQDLNNTTDTGQEQILTKLEGEVRQRKIALSVAKANLSLLESQQRQATETAENTESEILIREEGKVEVLKDQVHSAEKDLNLTKSMQNAAVDAAKNALDVANAALSETLSSSGHTKIIAPYSGVISQRYIDLGEAIKIGEVVFEILEADTEFSQISTATVTFGVPEHVAENIFREDVVEIFSPYHLEKVSEAQITRVSNAIDKTTRQLNAEADIFGDLIWKHNASVRVRIDTANPPIYSLPSSSVKREEGKNVIFVLEEDKPVPKEVKILSEDGEWAYLQGWIYEKSEVILNPPDQ